MIFPNPITFAKSLFRGVFKFLAGAPIQVPADVWQSRLKVCRSCSHYEGGQCQKCSCFVVLKSWLSYESCPLGSWVECSGSSHNWLSKWLPTKFRQACLRVCKALA